MADSFDAYRKANSFKTWVGDKYAKSKKTVSAGCKVDACNAVGEAVLKTQQDIAGSREPGETDGL